MINFNQITRIQMSFSHQQNSNNTKQKSFEQSLNSNNTKQKSFEQSLNSTKRWPEIHQLRQFGKYVDKFIGLICAFKWK